MVEAEKLYRAATDIQPLDIDGYTGLARATTALATVYPFVLHQPFPTKALPILEHLLGLMPVNLHSLSLLTKYYHVNKLDDELQAIVARSITTFPPFYSQLINQPFYTVGMNEMITTSLHTAIKNGVYVTEAYKALSRLALQEEDNQGAIDYFLKARPVAGYQDNSGYSLQLGRLYLLTGQVAEAEGSFLDALKTTGLEKRLDEIWAQYKMAKQYKPFLDFCKSAEGEKSLSEQLQLLRAKCFIEMERYELALSHLIRMNSPKYEAEGLYLQARIAEFLQDWDTMELRSQRATVIDGGNSSYLLLFSRALQNQKKWPQAEQAATAAIASSTVPNPWLYNHRAWLRWNRKDYDGAKTDWQKAIGLSPETAGFYYSMGLVYQQGKNINEAVRYLKKALTIKPGDQRYREKLTELTALQ
jgi:tetratricopeptide (TPR) repeat protein